MYDITAEMIIEIDVANPFITLSAYFTTTATIKPPVVVVVVVGSI